MVIGCSFISAIGGYCIGVYLWLLYWCLFVVIVLVAIGGYWWLFY
jgi:hypothetical protein